MANLQTVLKEAMAKVSRKEIRLMVGGQGHLIADLRRKMKALRVRVDQAERQVRSLQAAVAALPAPEATPPEGKRRRMTGKGIHALRRRLGLTQDEMAKFARVTTQAVYLWERKSGPIRLRETTLAELVKLQTIGRRDAKAMLDADAKRAADRKSARKPGRKPGRRSKG